MKNIWAKLNKKVVATVAIVGVLVVTFIYNTSLEKKSIELFKESLKTAPKGTFIAAGEINIPRYNHTATLLNDGRVFITGGTSKRGESIKYSELYDPITGRFKKIKNNIPVNTIQILNSALLPDGNVLINNCNYKAGLMIFSPKDNKFSIVNKDINFSFSKFVLLPNGKTLIFIPDKNKLKVYLYDYKTNSLTEIGQTEVPINSKIQTATLIPENKVLLICGKTEHEGKIKDEQGNPIFDYISITTITSEGLIFDYKSNKFTRVNNMQKNRSLCTATLLPNNKVLITGGDEDGTAELFDTNSNKFTLIGKMQHQRMLHKAILLNNDKVFLLGGYSRKSNSSYFSKSVNTEFYDYKTNKFTLGPKIRRRDIVPQITFQATLLNDGKVLLTGGDATPGRSYIIKQTDIYIAE